MKLLSIKEVCDELGIGRMRCETAIREGQIPAKKIGRYTMISAEFIENLREELLKSKKDSEGSEKIDK